jgi:hypothetical protein
MSSISIGEIDSVMRIGAIHTSFISGVGFGNAALPQTSSPWVRDVTDIAAGPRSDREPRDSTSSVQSSESNTSQTSMDWIHAVAMRAGTQPNPANMPAWYGIASVSRQEGRRLHIGPLSEPSLPRGRTCGAGGEIARHDGPENPVRFESTPSSSGDAVSSELDGHSVVPARRRNIRDWRCTIL